MPSIIDPIPLVDPVRRFVLFTNAKCGGTTLKSWFFANLDLPALERRPWRFLATYGPGQALRHLRRGRKAVPRGAALRDAEAVRRMTNYYRHAYCQPLIEAGGILDFFKLAVVRHPEDRVVSGFVDKICGEDRREPWVREVVAAAGGEGRVTFASFLDYLERTPDEICDPHWRRQTHILEGHRIDAFVRLEALAADFAAVAARVGSEHLDVFARRLQSNPYDPALAAAALAADMPARGQAEVIAWRETHGAFPPKEAFLTPETRGRIRRIYAKDFALLPYGDADSASVTATSG